MNMFFFIILLISEKVYASGGNSESSNYPLGILLTIGFIILAISSIYGLIKVTKIIRNLSYSSSLRSAKILAEKIKKMTTLEFEEYIGKSKSAKV